MDQDILTFGKHKGISFKKLPSTYLIWLLDSDIIKKEEYFVLKANIVLYLTSYYEFTFGKHKDMSLKWVRENHKEYLEWLVKCDFLEKQKTLKYIISLSLSS